MAAAAVMQPAPVLASSSTKVRSLDEQSNSKQNEDAVGTTASQLFAEKMAGVLRYAGYDEDAIAKVSNRVAANIVSSTYTPANLTLADADALSLFFDDELLNKKKLEKRNLYLNSNEPVLLIEVPAELYLVVAQAYQLKDDLLLALRTRGIKPVRVYARIAAENGCSHIGIVLLNVVNTDIGGPSMVQLLDAAFHGEAWRQSLTLKEAWNGYDLLWRDEAWSGGRHDEPEPEVHPTLDKSGNLAVPHEPEDEPVITVQDHRDVTSAPGGKEDVETETEPVEHPAMKELRERDASRAHVQHPTWARDHDNQHLLDIITTHSASVKESDPISVISRPADDSSDEFEVVDRA